MLWWMQGRLGDDFFFWESVALVGLAQAKSHEIQALVVGRFNHVLWINFCSCSLPPKNAGHGQVAAPFRRQELLGASRLSRS